MDFIDITRLIVMIVLTLVTNYNLYRYFILQYILGVEYALIAGLFHGFLLLGWLFNPMFVFGAIGIALFSIYIPHDNGD